MKHILLYIEILILLIIAGLSLNVSDVSLPGLPGVPPSPQSAERLRGDWESDGTLEARTQSVPPPTTRTSASTPTTRSQTPRPALHSTLDCSALQTRLGREALIYFASGLKSLLKGTKEAPKRSQKRQKRGQISCPDWNYPTFPPYGPVRTFAEAN